MAAPYQYPQHLPAQQYQQSQPYQQGQQYQQSQPPQQSYGSNYASYQQQHQYPSQQPPQQHYLPQHYQQQQQQQRYPHQQYPQQQYFHPQHPSQPYAATGQTPQQYHPPPQSGYQQPQGHYGQTTNPAPSQSCFNCGTPGHFAQNCPEPKRQVPAGAANPEQHRRQGIAPPKRSGQIVTKFAPHATSSQGSPSPYAPAYSSGGYPQYQQPHGQTYTPTYTPATPQSAPSPAQSWPPHQQAATQYQQYQQPQSNGYYQAPATPQQSWPTPITPASAAPFGPPQVNQASPTHSQHAFSTQTLQSQYEQVPVTPVQSTQQAPTPSQQPAQSLEGALNDAQAEQERQADEYDPAAADPKFIPPTLQEAISEDGDSEEDDLSLLDVPDLPPSTARYGEAVVPLVGMPIPANFIVADALFPMDPPPPEAQGCCLSKYVRAFQADTLSRNIKESTYWKDLKDDVAFSSLSTDGDFTKLDDCRSKIQQRRRPQDEMVRESRSESRSAAPPRKEATEAAKSLEQLQKALEQAKADIANREKRLKEKKGLPSPSGAQPSIGGGESLVKMESMSPPQSASIENGSGYQDDAEGLLASLGVTGTAKPVAPPTRLVSRNSSTNDGIKPRSRSASHAEIPSTEQYSNIPSTPYKNGHPQSSQNPQHHALPPFPAPAFHQHPSGQPANPDEGHGISTSAGVNPFGYRPNSTENGYGNYQHQRENQSPYAAQMRPDSSGNRKRGYDERSSSEESEEAARRQEDDITPKLKRRQPKVAEAYSRRW